VKISFEFRITGNGTRVVTKVITDFSDIERYFNSKNQKYLNFFPKSLKPIMAVLRHLPGNTPADEIYVGTGRIRFGYNKREINVYHPLVTRFGIDNRSPLPCNSSQVGEIS
jgi:hypothetical protein